MRRVILLSFLLLLSIPCFAASAADLSKQATAFYVDNNYNRTMDLILQIDEKERTAQDWLLLGNLMEEKEFLFEKQIIFSFYFFLCLFGVTFEKR